MNNRVSSIELFRFLFMVVICLWHFTPVVSLMAHGGLPVEFFFILSGFLMYRSACRTNAPGPLDYTLKKIKRFHFGIIVSGIFTLCCIHDWLPKSIHGNDIVASFRYVVDELFLLKTNGIFKGGLNSPMWYLSVLIWGGGLLYSILHKVKESSIRIYIPIFCWCAYTYMFNNGSMCLEHWSAVGCFPMPVVRGIAGMGLGVLTAHVMNRYSTSICGSVGTLFLNFAFCFGLLLMILTIMATEHYDEYVLIASPLIILACFNKNTWINKLNLQKILPVNYLGAISLEMLMVHYPIYKLFESYHSIINGLPGLAIVGIFLVVVIVVAAVLHQANDYYLKKVFGK